MFGCIPRQHSTRHNQPFCSLTASSLNLLTAEMTVNIVDIVHGCRHQLPLAYTSQSIYISLYSTLPLFILSAQDEGCGLRMRVKGSSGAVVSRGLRRLIVTGQQS